MYIHIHIYVCIYTHTRIHTHVCVYTYIHHTYREKVWESWIPVSLAHLAWLPKVTLVGTDP